ncbi:hypothetical protein AB0F81_42265 [Actinoplanes sp. NPDC024001]|uniref:hypothetical protein n=1 Tax=Actinoplanes sp. NPDC024001 TaxID=3154598 RepID=UPI0033F4F3C3
MDAAREEIGRLQAAMAADAQRAAEIKLALEALTVFDRAAREALRTVAGEQLRTAADTLPESTVDSAAVETATGRLHDRITLWRLDYASQLAQRASRFGAGPVDVADVRHGELRTVVEGLRPEPAGAADRGLRAAQRFLDHLIEAGPESTRLAYESAYGFTTMTAGTLSDVFEKIVKEVPRADRAALFEMLDSGVIDAERVKDVPGATRLIGFFKDHENLRGPAFADRAFGEAALVERVAAGIPVALGAVTEIGGFLRDAHRAQVRRRQAASRHRRAGAAADRVVIVVVDAPGGWAAALARLTAVITASGPDKAAVKANAARLTRLETAIAALRAELATGAGEHDC